ncbi:nuclear transport factor 2 family protein [Pseudofrankia inefficax]|uniref:Aromatic-ring-hydroxylating dioxygenase beta subunit n=1 Tax=Pseudofrankia inefficax (strain DSM 45817 / CECT 9037 / DDB 130130 / EuI1c) TaxID=298654 RepID=E3J7W2_PSEI1|nr:nuclear transport factor 2 family protein [Pseudofrankia inefficax]ADP80866.1 aromatic-ring-hydroxylating dioxygenase beta subunit [Pseudofrankia inefficax]
MDDATQQRLLRLADRADIIDCLARYARGMDRLDRDLARSAYHDDAIDDHAGFVGPVDAFLDWSFAYHRQQFRHQHYVTNHHIELAGDEAHVETYYLFVATERDPDEPLKVYGGRYVDRFERRDGRWAIAGRVCLPEWRAETTVFHPDLGGAVPLVNVISEDRTDTSYLRPLVVNSPAAADAT